VLKEMNASINGNRVRLMRNVPWEEAMQLTRQAGIYLGTSDPSGHPFGMPVSIAESLATGSYCLLRKDVPASAEYLGAAGALYGSPEEASAIIRNSVSWTDVLWGAFSGLAVKQATNYADHAVLPRLLEDWKAIS